MQFGGIGWRDWAAGRWNAIDTLIITLYGLSLAFRASGLEQFAHQQAAKATMAVNSVLLFLRLVCMRAPARLTPHRHTTTPCRPSSAQRPARAAPVLCDSCRW